MSQGLPRPAALGCPMAIGALRVGEFLDALASRTPTPGGGAAAGVMLATAAALGRMVLAFTVGKARYAAHAEEHARSEASLSRLQAEFLRLADEDAAAYATLNTAQRLPPEDPARSRLPDLLVAATEAPLRMAEGANEMAAILDRLRHSTNPHLASDLAIAIDLEGCGRRAALHNVQANLPLLDDSRRAGLSARAATAAGDGAH